MYNNPLFHVQFAIYITTVNLYRHFSFLSLVHGGQHALYTELKRFSFIGICMLRASSRFSNKLTYFETNIFLTTFCR